MTIAAILAFWTLAGWAFFGRDGGRLVHGFFLSLPFGSFAVLPPAATGGLTLSPTPIVALLILLRCLVRRGGIDALLTVAHEVFHRLNPSGNALCRALLTVVHDRLRYRCRSAFGQAACDR